MPVEVSSAKKDVNAIASSHIQILEARYSENSTYHKQTKTKSRSPHRPALSPIKSDTSFIQPVSSNQEKFPLYPDIVWHVISTHKVDLPDGKYSYDLTQKKLILIKLRNSMIAVQ